MDETLVVYTSKSGFTEIYANWIAEELGCEAIPLANLTPPRLLNAQRIVYGGPIHAGWVSGLKNLLKKTEAHPVIQVFVFGVGLTKPEDPEIKRYKAANLVNKNKNLPWYYFRGGMDIDRLQGFEKLVISLITKIASKKEAKEDPYGEEKPAKKPDPFHQSFVDRLMIKELVEAVKEHESSS